MGELQKVEYIHRDFKHQDLYYPDPIKDRKRRPDMYSTIHSPKSSVTTLHPLNNMYTKAIDQERDALKKKCRARSERKSEMNLSFYNNKHKSKVFMMKYNDDQYLT